MCQSRYIYELYAHGRQGVGGCRGRPDKTLEIVAGIHRLLKEEMVGGVSECGAEACRAPKYALMQLVALARVCYSSAVPRFR